MSDETIPFEEHFSDGRNGAFKVRYGVAADPDMDYCNKKLCFTATDKALLAEILYELSNQPTCFFVKYSTKPRGGLYLGRCFFMKAEDVGKTWAYYKNHPQMMCGVQDDDFTEPYRPAKSWAKEAEADAATDA